MRPLILRMSTSIDGFVGGPKGELDWMFAVEDETMTELDDIWNAGVHIMGSRTFHDMASWWPYSTEPVAAPMNEIPKLAFSRKGDIGTPGSRATQAVVDAKAATEKQNLPVNPHAERLAREWAATPVITGDLATEIARLKAEPGKPILAHGGAGFARSLVAGDLVDEFRLIVYPVALGRGLPIFSDLDGPKRLELVDQTRFPSGITANTWRPAQARPA